MGVVFLWPSLQFIQSTICQLRSEAAAAGRDFNSFSVIVSTGLEVTERPEAALEGFKEEMAVYHGIPGMDKALVGTKYDVPDIVSKIRRAMRTREIIDMGGWMEDFRRLSDFQAAAEAIPTGFVEEVAIAGDTDVVRRRLSEYRLAGVTHMFVPGPRGTSTEAYADFLASIQPPP